MSGRKKCSRDDCPRSNVGAEFTAKCGQCGEMVHLPCLGIKGKLNDVLVHPSLRVYCLNCAELHTTGSHTSTATVVLSKPTFDSIISELIEVKNIVRDTNEKVTANTNANANAIVQPTQSLADVIKAMNEVKKLTENTNEKLSSAGNLAVRKSTVFPSLDSPSSKRKRRDVFDESSADFTVEAPSRKFAGRQLLSGTSSDANHGLGVGVALATRPERSERTSAKLKKSIYVSRLSTDITADALTEYIKKQVEGVDVSDFSLRMLVKKDVDLSTKTFLSYRLACTETLYEKFMISSFWPSHVMIGEFIETPRPPRPTASVNDFLKSPIREVNTAKPSTSSTAAPNPPTPKPNTPKPPPKNGTPTVTMET